MKSLLKLVVVAAVGVSALAFAGTDSIEERIKPVGELCMAGDECAAAAAAPVSEGPRTGDVVYKAKCATCHATGAAGAPKLGDAAAWAPRIAKGMETLHTHAISGFNGMPAKGLCFDCSDDELKAAVDYMVEESK